MDANEIAKEISKIIEMIILIGIELRFRAMNRKIKEIEKKTEKLK